MSKKITIKRRTPLGAKFKSTKKKGKGALPSFPIKISVGEEEEKKATETDDQASCGLEDLPCDTLLALQSLQMNDQGLHIPLGRGRIIQAILPSQLFQRFKEGCRNARHTMLHALSRSNGRLDLTQD